MPFLAGTGYSMNPDPIAAVREAAKRAQERSGLARADLALLFASTSHAQQYPALAAALREQAGVSQVVGCSAHGVLTEEREIESGICLAVMLARLDGVSVRPFLTEVTPTGGDEFLRGLREAVARPLDAPASGDSLAVLFTDIFHLHPAPLVAYLRDAEALPVVGAAASGAPDLDRTYQWSGERSSTRGVSGLSVHGATVTIRVAQGCKPIGEPGVITACDRNVVMRIGSRTAVEALRAALATLPPDDAPYPLSNLFAGLAMDPRKQLLERGDFLVRNIIGLDQDSGGLAVAERVREGQTLQFQLRSPMAAHQDMRQMVGELAQRVSGRSPALGLYFDCMGRGEGLYGIPSHDISAIKERFPKLPVVGFFGNAEFAPVGATNFVHNYTGVLALLS